MITLAEPSPASRLQPPVSDVKITCLILTFNEEHRIRTALTHALRWADEVVVVDKGSTDNTCDLAIEHGARVHQIPFSPQGHESYADMVAGATHDWVWHFTPGEVPTPRVIYAAKELISQHAEQLSLILIPTKLWSFGVHDPRSPWGFDYQPRLYHKGRVRFTGIAHAPLVPSGHVTRVEAGHDCFVYHPTHATAAAFIRSHADYAINEARRAEPDLVLANAIQQSNAHDQAFAANPALLCQQIAWKVYWLQVALHAAERQSARNVPKIYDELTTEALKAWSA